MTCGVVKTVKNNPPNSKTNTFVYKHNSYSIKRMQKMYMKIVKEKLIDKIKNQPFY